MFVASLSRWLGIATPLQNFSEEKQKEHQPIVCHTLRRNTIERVKDNNFDSDELFNSNISCASTSSSIEHEIDEDGSNCGENEDEFLEASTSFHNLTDERCYVTSEEEKSLQSFHLIKNNKNASGEENEKSFEPLKEEMGDALVKSIYLDAEDVHENKLTLGNNLNQSIYEDALDEDENICNKFLLEVNKSDIEEQKIFLLSDIKALSDSLINIGQDVNFLLNNTSTIKSEEIPDVTVDLSSQFKRKEDNVKMCSVFDTKDYDLINVKNVEFKDVTVSAEFTFNSFANISYSLSFVYLKANNYSLFLNTLGSLEVSSSLSTTFTNSKSICETNIVYYDKVLTSDSSQMSVIRCENKSELNLCFEPLHQQSATINLNKKLSNSLEDRTFPDDLAIRDLSKTNLLLWSPSEVTTLSLYNQEASQMNCAFHNNENFLYSGYLPQNFLPNFQHKMQIDISDDEETDIEKYTTSSGSEYDDFC